MKGSNLPSMWDLQQRSSRVKLNLDQDRGAYFKPYIALCNLQTKVELEDSKPGGSFM